ncbi:MAG TPA: hypothetical protein VIU12_16940 [Chryseolinea sp.]
MKTSLTVAVPFVLIACLLFAFHTRPAPDAVAEQDEQAIRHVIEAETAAYFNKDSTKLFSFYVDDRITQSAWNAPNGSYGAHKGLASIHKNFTEAFRKNPKPQPQPNIQRSQWLFQKFSNEWMWVNFVQETDGADGKRYTNYETRIMKKVGSEWKITVMYSLGDHGLGSH